MYVYIYRHIHAVYYTYERYILWSRSGFRRMSKPSHLKGKSRKGKLSQQYTYYHFSWGILWFISFLKVTVSLPFCWLYHPPLLLWRGPLTAAPGTCTRDLQNVCWSNPIPGLVNVCITMERSIIFHELTISMAIFHSYFDITRPVSSILFSCWGATSIVSSFGWTSSVSWTETGLCGSPYGGFLPHFAAPKARFCLFHGQSYQNGW